MVGWAGLQRWSCTWAAGRGGCSRLHLVEPSCALRDQPHHHLRPPTNYYLPSGKLLHIDFGDCFEASMNREKFPEKVPFRLTRMMVKAMEVSGIEGNFRCGACGWVGGWAGGWVAEGGMC